MKLLIYTIINLILIISFSNVSALGSGTTNSGAVIPTTSNIFKLEGVKVIYDNELMLTFNHTLLNIEGLPVDLKIKDNNDVFNTFIIGTTTISGNTLNVKLDTPLKISTEYEMIIYSIVDTNYDSIGKGVNASKIFKTPITFNIKPVINNISVTNTGIELNNINGNISVTNTGIELNSAADVNLNSIFNDVIPKEKATTNEKTANTFETAQNTKKLPNTGPAEWLLLAISLFFGLIYFTFKTKFKN